MEKWFVINKGADFAGIAKRFGISPVTARLIRNREVMGDEAIARYLKGGIGELYDPHLLLDSDRLTDILVQKISEQKKIRVIGDYDIDGVMSTYILYKGITRCGGSVDFQIPDRMKDGYGINDHLIEQADEAGIDTIITCDNGIAAIGEIAHAKSLGMTVLVTDHHEIPYTEERGERHYKRSEADAIVNPKQMECTYPYKNLCGAAVAWKVIQILYEKCDIAVEESYDFLENVAFATVGDVMDLTDENRILVREGLKRIHTTMNPGMRALILQNKLEPEQISSYHFGFVLGPCINASGRLETAKIALNLFLQEDVKKASEIAAELVDLNAQRKDMTAEGVELAMQQVEEGNTGEKVLVVYLPDVHERHGRDRLVAPERRLHRGLRPAQPGSLLRNLRFGGYGFVECTDEPPQRRREICRRNGTGAVQRGISGYLTRRQAFFLCKPARIERRPPPQSLVRLRLLSQPTLTLFAVDRQLYLQPFARLRHGLGEPLPRQQRRYPDPGRQPVRTDPNNPLSVGRQRQDNRQRSSGQNQERIAAPDSGMVQEPYAVGKRRVVRPSDG